MRSKIVSTLEEKGPLVGTELYRSVGGNIFELWRRSNLEFRIKRVGRRYLRLDKRVKGYARLSPAMEREFLTYSVIGLPSQEELASRRADLLWKEIKAISAAKMSLAQKVAAEVSEGMDPDSICFVIGGDVPLEMAHRDPRPESSSGKMVAGSDLDVVVIIRDDFPEEMAKRLDESLYSAKYDILNNPRHREELDYIVKRRSKMDEQMNFDSFESMVACKILYESKLLHGSEEFFSELMALLTKKSISSKLSALEKAARAQRRKAEGYLLKKGKIDQEEYKLLFTTSAEFGEVF